MPVVGTAGHVDHGKSTLVRVLTGRDPDRWAEEKRRGLTIDLGFAWTELPSGVEVGFVDVPGHERFIKNMLAGVDAITVALFVVAADEGWMPQSEEHLAILDLLEVPAGIVALTRADLVDSDTIELVTLEIDERLGGTCLAGSPIVPTAAMEGRGVTELTALLDQALAANPVQDVGRPRMWIDRSFSMPGAGTVLTGTLLDGSLAVDDVVTILPDRDQGRIRSIQSHEKSLTEVGPGRRTAISVVGVERGDVGRGAMLGRPDDWAMTRRFGAHLRTIRSLGAPIRERGSYHLHVGSGSWPVVLRLIGTESVESTGFAILETADELPLKWGDRFVLREVGRQAVVAGGRVLDPHPARGLAAAAESLPALADAVTPGEAAQQLLDSRGSASLVQLAAETGGGTPPSAVRAESRGYSMARVEKIDREAASVVAEFHDANPLRAGIPKASLAERLGVETADLEVVLAGSTRVELVGSDARTIGFGVDLAPGDQAAWDRARKQLEAAGFAAPRRTELGLTRELEHALLRSGDLIEVAADFLYLPSIADDVVAATRAIGSGFTVADFRDALGITRKHAIPLLEWMDRSKVTVRDGDVRRTTGG